MRLFFSVGEPSGDQHAAHLIAELRRRHPDAVCYGYGGPEMVRQGFEQVYPLTNLAVMGFWRVLPLLWKFISLGFKARRMFRESPPDAVVLVDFPGFNWWIARFAKACGIPVYYYCPPQLWAWAPWRIRKVRRYVDHVLCCLPFEAQWYRDRGVAAVCVGHPFFDEVADHKLDAEFLMAQRATPGPLVGILPGSRSLEVEGNFPIQLRVMRELHKRVPYVRFLVACHRPALRDRCEALLAKTGVGLPVQLYVGKTPEIIQGSDAALMVSGSVSLELLARKTPAVVLYRCSAAFYKFCRLIATIKYMSLPNLVVNREVMPEFPTINGPPEDVAEMTRIIEKWLTDPAAHRAQVAELDQILQQIHGIGATQRVADYLCERLAPPAVMPTRRAA